MDINDFSQIPQNFVENRNPIPLPHPLEVTPLERSIWVLARPIKAARGFSFLSEGKFPICHWGLLASDLSPLSFKLRWDSKERIESGADWGTLFELVRDENDKNTVHEVEHFGANMEFVTEWKTVAIMFIGTTFLRDADLSAQGKRHQQTLC